jgi:hypothetical protein|tara:strand:+ start:1173 stop:1466 length:294 start_codon:yes stop_codon:yes gene_type:complete
MPTKKEKALLRRYGLKGFDKPKRTPKHKTKSHVVLTRVDGKPKLIRFGAQGADNAPRGRKSESKADKAKRAAFKKRHAKNIARGKRSAAWWANKVKW